MSIVEQTDYAFALRGGVGRTRSLERSGSPWIYVGTVGVDGIDALITPDSPAFQNGWTHSLGADPPVSFCRVNGWIHIRGGYIGGADGTVVFTLPVGFRPSHQQPFVIATSATNHYATFHVATNGDVVFGTIV